MVWSNRVRLNKLESFKYDAEGLIEYYVITVLFVYVSYFWVPI